MSEEKMKYTGKSKLSGLAFVFGALVASSFFVTAAKADYVYSYQGPIFGSNASTPFAPGESITGEFTFASAIPDSTDDQNFTPATSPISWEFTDGLVTYSSAVDNGGGLLSFELDTGADGSITGWDFRITDFNGDFIQSAPLRDLDTIGTNTYEVDSQVGNVGTWTVSASGAATPEPGTLSSLLLGTALVCLAALRRRTRCQPRNAS